VQKSYDYEPRSEVSSPDRSCSRGRGFHLYLLFCYDVRCRRPEAAGCMMFTPGERLSKNEVRQIQRKLSSFAMQ